MSEQRDSDKILHEDETKDVIDEVVEAGVGKDNPAIDDVDAVGSTYSQAEVNAIVDAVNDVLAALRENGIVASSV